MKENPISVNKKIPQGTIMIARPGICRVPATYQMHSYLAGKKAILYGLPGYISTASARKFDASHFWARSRIWNAFRLDRVMKPAIEFIQQVECLIGDGVDEVLFLTVNFNACYGALKNQTILEKYQYFKFVAANSYYYNALGLESDIKEEKIDIPPRTRRFMLLVDNLMVKFANIESSDGRFIVPSVEEICNAFHQ